MALLELLAGAAPAGVVAADLLGVVEAAGLHGDRRLDRLRGHLAGLLRARRHRRAGRCRDRVAAREPAAARGVEVARGARAVAAEAPARPAGGRLLRLLHLHLDVEHVPGELVPD